MNRQRLILFILSILFVVSVIWSYTAMPRPKTASTLKYTQGQQIKSGALSANSASGTVADSRILKLDLLEQRHSAFKGYRRNIFKPVFVDELKVMKQKASAIRPLPSLPVQPVITVPVVPAQPVVAMPVSAPLAHFTFLGFLKKDARRTIFLAKDKEILLVRKGDKIAGRYEASSITDQALTLLVTETGDEIVIPLIENRPLTFMK